MGNDNALPRYDGRCPFELSLQQQQGLIRDRAKCFEGLDHIQGLDISAQKSPSPRV